MKCAKCSGNIVSKGTCAKDYQGTSCKCKQPIPLNQVFLGLGE